MSNQRPTDDEIRKRLEMFRKAACLGNAAGVPPTDEIFVSLVAIGHALQWVLGEDSELERLHLEAADLVRSTEAMLKQNFRDN